jgi:hypothetical protein
LDTLAGIYLSLRNIEPDADWLASFLVEICPAKTGVWLTCAVARADVKANATM